MAEARAFPVAEPETLRMTTRDGAVLVADLYGPIGAGACPVLLMRQPYGRRIASTVVLAHPAWYAARGYRVVVQDVRGRGESGGEFCVLESEAADGAEALAWAADLAGGTGQVATYGFSYQAMTQLLALAGASRAGTKRPDAIVPAMGAWSVRDDWAFEGDAFRLADSQGWACQVGAESARLAGDRPAFAALAAAGRGAPWTGPDPARPEVLSLHGAHVPHYARWLADDPEAWAVAAPMRALAGDPLDVPGLFTGGWLDGMLEGTLAMHAAFRAAGRAPQRLLVGPWPHMPWNGAAGGLPLGDEAASPLDGETVRFLDHSLRGEGEAGPAVRLFDLLARRWRDFAAFPAPDPTALHLVSSGRAAASIADGRLSEAPVAAATDRLVHDPWRPAPAVGGHHGRPGGFQDRAEVDRRGDVATYTGAPLARALDLAGPVAAELSVACDRPSHDLHCALSVLLPDDARAIVLTTGHRRVADAAAPGQRRVGMRATCATLPAGARLRLSVQAAAVPAFAVNFGTGARPEDADPFDARITTLSLAHGGPAPSRLLLPVLR